MRCKNCGILGHDSQGDPDLCYTAIKDRCLRLENAPLLIASWENTDALNLNAAGVGYEAVRLAVEALG